MTTWLSSAGMKSIASFLFVAVALFAMGAERLIDDKLATKADVVLRVKRLTPGEGSKYLWYRVEVVQVLKNDSSEIFTNALSVAANSWKPGVPEGESTIYLERYNKTGKALWKLVGGEASTGVSHANKQSLTAEQAKALAIRLANDKASTLYHSQPFGAGQPAQFVTDHWLWAAQQGFGSGDIQARVELAADGSTNSVNLQLFDSKNIFREF
jgi:hypothetical protein